MKYIVGIVIAALAVFGMQYVVAQGNDARVGLTDWGIAKDNPMRNFK